MSSAPASSILDLIGQTPLVRVRHIDTDPCELYLKLESQNPGGSVKDRIALHMIESAEREGRIKPGATLIEATAGNTGLALAMVARQKGYRLIVVVFDKVSQEKIFHLRALGAEIVITRSDVFRGHPDYYQDKARALAASTPDAFYVNQFENPANPGAHEKFTGPEIWQQMEQRVDAVVCGAGSGGTLTGVGRFFKKVSPETRMILADPKGSVLAPWVEHGVMIEPGQWLVEGIGEDFIPANCDLSLVTKAYTVPDEESIAAVRELLLKEGVMAGSSSGTLLTAALRWCREQKTPKRVVTFVCDSGAKYLSKIYNPYWLQDQGFDGSAETHDLRDLIARSYKHGDVISVAPNDTLQRVYARMKMYDVSQVPVMEGDKIIGIIDETDMLMAVAGNLKGFSIRAGAVMRDKLVSVEIGQPVTDLMPVFERGRVACVCDKGQFLGLVTPIDFLKYLRKRTG